MVAYSYFYRRSSRSSMYLSPDRSYSNNNRVQFIRGGSAFFKLMEQLIGEASDTIHLQYYIIEDDQTGRMIIEPLIRASRRGVKVYILADGYASQGFPDASIHRMKEEGIMFKFFEPLLKSKYFYFGRRLHHKIFVVDTTRAMIGGLNISNRYNDLPGQPAWLDFALFAEGQVAVELCILCWKTWNRFPLKMGLTPCEKVPRPEIPQGSRAYVRMRRNDWVRGKNQISNTYYHMFRTARKQVTLLSSYFLPGKTLRRLMSKARKRGVRIRVISAGASDVMLVKYAERWLYDWLLRNEIELYEYQKNILHGKLGICDYEWFTLGSYNINDISAYASVELNLDVIQPAMTQDMLKLMDKIIAEDCVRITLEKHKKSKNVFIQFGRWLSFEFIRVVFYLFTFYYQQKK